LDYEETNVCVIHLRGGGLGLIKKHFLGTVGASGKVEETPGTAPEMAP